MHFIGWELGDQLISSELCLSSEDAPDKVQDILSYEESPEKKIKQNVLERKHFQTIFIGVEKLMSVINGTHNAPFVTFSYEWFSQLSSKISE